MRKSWPISTGMPTLLELQLELRRAALGGDTGALVGTIRDDGLDPAARVRIYRNHAFATLGAVLEGTFPVVCRLVDKRFFAYAAHEYLREHPPHSRCLVEYGAEFADFLAGLEACNDLPYLADVARFEWALNVAATVREACPLKIEALAGIAPEGASLLKISLQPSVSYFASGWPIDAIWLANQRKEVRPVDLTSGGTTVEIRRADEGFSWQRLPPGVFAFRRALAEGFALGTAAATAA
ncbi:MAG: DNA-binding domain-containing protein, partial [Stellaceae bacterium]